MAINISCDKHNFVATKLVVTRLLLSRQTRQDESFVATTYFCRNKRRVLSRHGTRVCRNKTYVTTKMILVAANDTGPRFLPVSISADNSELSKPNYERLNEKGYYWSRSEPVSVVTVLTSRAPCHNSLIIIARPSCLKAVFERVRVFSSVIMVIRPWRQIHTAHLDDDFKGYMSGVYTTQLLSSIQSNVQMPSTAPDRRRLRNKYDKNNENVEPIKGVN